MVGYIGVYVVGGVVCVVVFSPLIFLLQRCVGVDLRLVSLSVIVYPVFRGGGGRSQALVEQAWRQSSQWWTEFSIF